MDVTAFVQEFLDALAKIKDIQSVSANTEGPIVNGRARIDDEKFLSFYYNQVTGTQAFALIDGDKRIWGIDYDNQRGWHVHPIEAPQKHKTIETPTVTQIIEAFGIILEEL